MITPEPAGDINAQLMAVCNPNHPKKACFVLPQDWGHAYVEPDEAWVVHSFVVERPEGVLFTLDKVLAETFRNAPAEPEAAFDLAMAGILGYPEAKPIVMLACGGMPLARVVQARNADDWVIHEALTSPAMLQRTSRELQKHVPPGGKLVVLPPDAALARRVSLREAGK